MFRLYLEGVYFMANKILNIDKYLGCWNPAGIYLFKSAMETPEQCVKYIQS